jgi:transcriptional regulator with XRE-family HTH domain
LAGSRKDSTMVDLFAEELQAARERAGLTAAELGAQVNYSGSQISMIETRRRIAPPGMAQRLDQALGTPGTFERMQRRLKASPFPSWFRPWVEIEAAASQLRSWQSLVVDGLLQTSDYAQALLSARVGTGAADIEEQLAARMSRQAILDRDDPPLLWIVMDNGVLRRPVGNRHIMLSQCEHLVEMSARPNVIMQVIPASTGVHDGLNGAFVIADFADAPSIAYLETAMTGMIVEQPGQVADLNVIYTGLNTEALPRAASIELIKEVAKEWTSS